MGHTPGPWKAGNHGQRNYVFGPDGKAVAEVQDRDVVLVAAAPELLEALEALFTWMCDYTGPRDGTLDMIHRAMRVLKKAKGDF